MEYNRINKRNTAAPAATGVRNEGSKNGDIRF
jgi:hypothetical protein